MHRRGADVPCGRACWKTSADLTAFLRIRFLVSMTLHRAAHAGVLPVKNIENTKNCKMQNAFSGLRIPFVSPQRCSMSL